MVGCIDPYRLRSQDDVDIMDSPLLNSPRPNQDSRPSTYIFPDLMGDDIDADRSEIDEADFSLQSCEPSGVKSNRLSETVPSQGDAILVDLPVGGKELEVARTAATEPVASEDEMPDDYLNVALKATRHAQLEGDAPLDPVALLTEASKPTMTSMESKHWQFSSSAHAPSPIYSSPPMYHDPLLISPFDNLLRELPSPGGSAVTAISTSYDHKPLRISHEPILFSKDTPGDSNISHVNSFNGPYYCPVKGCPRAEGEKGYKRKMDMIRHRRVHKTSIFQCPICKHNSFELRDHQRHVRVHHVDKDKDDAPLRFVFSQGPVSPSTGRRQRGGTRYDVAKQSSANNQGDGGSQSKMSNLEQSFNLSSSLEGEMSERHPSIRAEPMTAEPQLVPPTQPSEWSAKTYIDTNGGIPEPQLKIPIQTSKWPSIDFTFKDTDSSKSSLDLTDANFTEFMYLNWGISEPQLTSPIQSNELWSTGLERSYWVNPETENFELTSPESEIHEPRRVRQHLIGTSDDVPFTDSGYSSLPHNLNHPFNISSSLEKLPNPATTEKSISMNDIDRDDAKTSYSAATTVGPVYAQNYITELCADIYGRLRQCVNSKLWSTLSRDLPVLIKAFAIKIGHDSSAQANQDIMYFLHRRHDQVFRQLEAIFQREDEIVPETPGAEGKSMSLHEKLSLWDSKAGEDRSVVEIDELYQGVKDDEEEITDQVDLSVYHKTILDSAAYEWFLASLKREITLQWSATQPRVMVESIRQRILDQLPTGTISKRKALDGHEVEFDLQLGDTFKTKFEHGSFDQLTRSDQLFAELITVTGSAEEAQALTIKQYISQTWSTSGPRLLDILQSTINSRYHHYCVILPDNTQLEARIGGSHLTVTATGPAHFIAECGEQLAWLQAALSSESQHCASYYTPSITSYRVGPSHSEKLNYEGYCKIGLEIAQSKNPGDTMSRGHTCWQDLVGSSAIIAGYPISRRPESYPGLELPFDTLLHLLQAENTSIANRSIFIKGQSKTVQLIKHSDDIFLWHPLHTYGQGCSCCTDHHVGLNATFCDSSLDLYILKAGRHILSDCAHLEAVMNKNMNANRLFGVADSCQATHTQNRVFPETNPVNSLCLNHKHSTTGQNEGLPMLPSYREDTAIMSPLTSSSADLSVSADGLPSFQENQPGTDIFLSESILLAADSQSIAMEHSNDSLDSDFLSMSDPSEQIEPLDSSEPTYSLLNSFLQELLSDFRSITQCQLSPGENGERFVTQSSATESSNTTGNSVQCRKNKRELEDDDEFSEDGFRKPPRKKINPGQSKVRQRTLACPYLKLDPIKHRNCCKYQLTEIKYVKQHLHRRHTPEFYCQRCFKTDFRDQQNLQSHVNLGTCPIENPSILEGISNQQEKQLSRKSNPKLSEENQWFAIWKILFLGAQPPLSVYMDPCLSEEMCLFREYFVTRGPAVLVQQIESNPAWSGMDVTAEQRQIHLNRVLSQGLNSIFEDYSHSFPSPDSVRDRSASSSQQLNHNLQPTQLATSTSSHSDSGVALGSQLSSSPSMSRAGLLGRQSSIEEPSSQIETVAGIRVQDAPTTQAPVAEPSQNHGHNLEDSTFDHFFEDQFLDAEWPALDQNSGFDIGNNPDFWSEFNGANKNQTTQRN